MYPGFTIEIRQGYFTGGEEIAAARKFQVGEKTKYGREAKKFGADHVEETWLFDLSMLTTTNPRITTVAPDVAYNTYGSEKSLRCFEFEVQDGMSPAHMLGQSTEPVFRAGSHQAVLSGMMRSQKKFTIIMDGGDPYATKNNRQKYVADNFRDRILTVRGKSYLQGNTND